MGILIALTIILIWSGHLYYLLTGVSVDFSSPIFYLHIMFQGYLYTGLFITAHDAMHGTISNSKNINNIFGYITAILFAGLSYKKLKSNHYKHHSTPAEKDDPDFNIKTQNFFLWWLTFLFKYATITQLIFMAIVFNILKIWIPEIRIWFYLVIPAFLGSLQLFYFGTYLPHKYPHSNSMKPHNTRTQKSNHLWAMLSCYFFGYHLEHHENPQVPWWKLYKIKNGIRKDKI